MGLPEKSLQDDFMNSDIQHCVPSANAVEQKNKEGQRIGLSDEEFKEEIIKSWDKFIGFAHSITARNSIAAEDVLLVSYEKMWKARQKFRREASFSTWGSTIISNEYKSLVQEDARRRKCLVYQGEGEDGYFEGVFSGLSQSIWKENANNPADILIAEELKRAYPEIMSELMNSRKGRSVSLLVEYLEGDVTYKELADKHSMMINTVKSNISNAKCFVANALEDRGFG